MVANNTLKDLIDKKDWDGARKFLSSGPTDGSEDDFIANILYQNDWSGWTTLMRAVHNKAPTDIITSLIDKDGMLYRFIREGCQRPFIGGCWRIRVSWLEWRVEEHWRLIANEEHNAMHRIKCNKYTKMPSHPHSIKICNKVPTVSLSSRASNYLLQHMGLMASLQN